MAAEPEVTTKVANGGESVKGRGIYAKAFCVVFLLIKKQQLEPNSYYGKCYNGLLFWKVEVSFGHSEGLTLEK